MMEEIQTKEAICFLGIGDGGAAGDPFNNALNP